jgi:putative DNA primase/helicase
VTLQEACNQIDIEYKEVPADGNWKRTAVIGKGKGNSDGSIKLFADGAGGRVGNWTKGETLTFWHDDTPTKLTADQKRELAARITEAANQDEADKADCRQKSVELWELAHNETPASHDYLIKKHVKPYGIRWQKSGNLLVVPVIDMAGTLHGLQFINAEGEKKFKSHTVKKGHFHRIPGKEKIVICEGYATGATIHGATGFCVLIAFGRCQVSCRLCPDC